MQSSFSVAVFLLILGVAVTPSERVCAQTDATLRAHSTETEIDIDGRLDDSPWSDAPTASGFRQLQPAEGQPASQETEFRVLYGPSSVYIGAVLHDDNSAGIMAALGRRDQLNQADWFLVSIDGYNNQESAYVFGVNAGGIQYDAVLTGTGFGPEDGMDESWDAIWESAVEIGPQGWTVEMRIPYSMLRFAEGDDTWGLHIRRWIPRRGERVEWPLVPQGQRQNLLSEFGTLTNLQGVSPERNVQIRPYTVSRLNSRENRSQPGEAAHSATVDAGGDLKVGLSSNLTLDLTVNPDFGQVESDPARLNLTAFETFYDEKRPFFLEGAEIYQFGLERRSDLLYTRRIGAQAPIVGATKLSGQTSSGLSFGLLGATTGSRFNPTRHYGVTRFTQQIGTYSSAGGILTAHAEPFSEGRYRTVTGGADWDLRLLDNEYGLDGYTVFSHRRWSPEDRPLETGFGANLQWSRRRGTWTYDAAVTAFDEKFDPNDLGRMRRNNYVEVGGGLQHQINGGQPFGPFQQAFLGIFSDQRWSYQRGIDQGFQFMSFSNWTLDSFQHLGFNLGGDYLFGGYDLYETRGLGPAHQPAEYQITFEFGSDERRNWRIRGASAEFTFMDDGGRSVALEVPVEWTIGTRLSLSGELGTEWERNVVAWTSNDAFIERPDGWAISTEPGAPGELGASDYQLFDTRGEMDAIVDNVPPWGNTEAYYFPVFGARDTRSLDLTLRSNFTFTQDISLQFYGQLFLARGQYQDFRIQKNRHTRVRFPGYPKRDAFSLHSFQANTVLRWEYRPGSQLYLVWTQSRRANNSINPLAPTGSSPYQTTLGEQVTDTFGLFPHNVFLVKLDYTILQ